MYRIPGIDEEESLRQLLGATPYDNAPQGFQPQPTQIQQGLLGDTSGLEADLQSLANSDAGAQLAQWAQMGAGGGGQNRIAQQQATNQQAMSNKGGGLLGFAMNFLPWGKWLGNAGKAVGKAVGL